MCAGGCGLPHFFYPQIPTTSSVLLFFGMNPYEKQEKRLWRKLGAFYAISQFPKD
jgi:hypothetical protein